MERIASRSPEFVTDYFTKEEQVLVDRASADMRDVAVTAVWSAKEAALKALHLGLTVDTRAVTCLLEVGEKRRSPGRPSPFIATTHGCPGQPHR
ncbi:MAG: 4'-phosphopantetheinyl transferase superfamily protein [Chloroflexi bacterium]|nr:4'-phosphopantetheinyl transferase superfamily protein [Chloroflexota bacterium]